MYDIFSSDGNALQRNTNPHYIIEGTMVPVYLDGELIKEVGLCWEWSKTPLNEYEICDVRYGSIDGVILPDWDDVVACIQEKMGLSAILILPDKFSHDKNL